jgi:hypothetical protein
LRHSEKAAVGPRSTSVRIAGNTFDIERTSGAPLGFHCRQADLLIGRRFVNLPHKIFARREEAKG